MNKTRPRAFELLASEVRVAKQSLRSAEHERLAARKTRLMEAELQNAADLRLRALVVEDDRDAADTLAVLLRRDGLDVAVARDGLDALVQASQQRPDVVLLDVLLPKLNGLDVCTYIRATEWGQRTAVIALTGWSRTSDLDRITRAGFDVHLVKPFGAEELFNAVRSTLEIRRSAE